MKALSVKEPWASLIASGKKTIETRTWRTKYRGDILICGSKTPKSENSGKALCIVHLDDIFEMIPEHEMRACCSVYPKAQSWLLSNLRLVEPFPVKGQLNLYEVDDHLIKPLEVVSGDR